MMWLTFVICLTTTDILSVTLPKVGLTVDELSLAPKKLWFTYPSSYFTLPVVEGILATPSAVDGFTRSFYTAFYGCFNDTFRLAPAIQHLMRRAGYKSGAYGSNLVLNVDETAPLVRALADLYYRCGERPQHRGFAGYEEEDRLKLWADTFDVVPWSVREVIAKLIYGVLEISYWVRSMYEDVDLTKLLYLEECWYYPSDRKFQLYAQEVATNLHYELLWYATSLLAHLIDSLRNTLMELSTRDYPEFELTISTPMGNLIIGGAGANTYQLQNAFIVVDLGGDDRYTGRIAGTYHNLPVAIVIDLSGNDVYHSDLPAGLATGMFGVACLYDLHGDDRYEGSSHVLGAGYFGAGLLIDEHGNDVYRATKDIAEAAGIFGVGMLVDITGNDYYYVGAEGQGYGGPKGMGLLVDVTGNDSYESELDPHVFDRADYHTDYKYNATSSQGAGMGRRGDGDEGYSWSGGIGVLLDFYGDDEYLAGSFSQGIGYWFGMGLLIDLHGDDTYKSIYFTQGSAAHFAIGVLWDVTGDDRHELFAQKGAALGFGWDCTVSLLYDSTGNDYYTADRISLGCAEVNSIAMFIELEGNDTYEFTGKLGLGATDARGPLRPEWDARQYLMPAFGLFYDAKGIDKYTAGVWGNNKIWFIPDSTRWKALPPHKRGVGIDLE